MRAGMPDTSTMRPISTTVRCNPTNSTSTVSSPIPNVRGSARSRTKGHTHAITRVVPEHLQEVRGRRLSWIEKTRAAVKDRLTKEFNYWDHRAAELKLLEQAGKTNARLNSQEANRRADDLQARLQKRLEQLDLEAQISALPPVVMGGLW